MHFTGLERRSVADPYCAIAARFVGGETLPPFEEPEDNWYAPLSQTPSEPRVLPTGSMLKQVAPLLQPLGPLKPAPAFVSAVSA